MSKSLHDQFCVNVKARRIAQGLTQKELGDLLGVSNAYIAEIEAGRHTPGLELVERIAKALKTTASELLAIRNKSRKPIDTA